MGATTVFAYFQEKSMPCFADVKIMKCNFIIIKALLRKILNVTASSRADLDGDAFSKGVLMDSRPDLII
jgi:hypothetical protein